jgi:hypothetical protein
VGDVIAAHTRPAGRCGDVLGDEVLALKPLDTLVMATDGIGPEFDEWSMFDVDPQHMADGILNRH